MFKRIAGIAAVMFTLGFNLNAHALVITTTDAVLTGNQTSQADIDAIILPFIAPATELYKQDVGGAESGAVAGSYETIFAPAMDPDSFTITYVGGAVIDPIAWLLAKDGAQIPAWYLFNLTALGWNGTDTIQGNNFWPQMGAISHVALYGGGTTTRVSEPAPLAVLGIGLVALAWLRRRKGVRT